MQPPPSPTSAIDDDNVKGFVRGLSEKNKSEKTEFDIKRKSRRRQTVPVPTSRRDVVDASTKGVKTFFRSTIFVIFSFLFYGKSLGRGVKDGEIGVLWMS